MVYTQNGRYSPETEGTLMTRRYALTALLGLLMVVAEAKAVPPPPAWATVFITYPSISLWSPLQPAYSVDYTVLGVPVSSQGVTAQATLNHTTTVSGTTTLSVKNTTSSAITLSPDPTMRIIAAGHADTEESPSATASASISLNGGSTSGTAPADFNLSAYPTFAIVNLQPGKTKTFSGSFSVTANGG